jgi:uncharacterized protein GlcG (DUF336 family)
MHVTIAEAELAIDAARKRAAELGTQMCIAIVDSGASLKAFYRMDDAWVGSIDIAIKTAKTTVFFGMPTGQIGKLSQPARSRDTPAGCAEAPPGATSDAARSRQSPAGGVR